MNTNPFQPVLDHWYTGENAKLRVLILEIDRTLKKALELAGLVQQKSKVDVDSQQTAHQAIREIIQELLQQDQTEQFTIQRLLQEALNIDSSSPVAKLLSKLYGQLDAVKEKLMAFKQQLDLEETAADKQTCQEEQLSLAVHIKDLLTKTADELTHSLFVELKYYNPALRCPQCKKNYVTIQEETIDSSTKMYTYTCHSCSHTESASDESLPRVKANWVVSTQLV